MTLTLTIPVIHNMFPVRVGLTKPSVGLFVNQSRKLLTRGNTEKIRSILYLTVQVTMKSKDAMLSGKSKTTMQRLWPVHLTKLALRPKKL